MLIILAIRDRNATHTHHSLSNIKQGVDISLEKYGFETHMQVGK